MIKFMKKLFLLLLSILVTGTMNAGKVSEQEAYKKAQHILQGKQLKTTRLNRAKQISGFDEAFYVFNAENNGGFVIVSSDDRTPDILGYSMHGEFNIDNMPCNVSWLLNCYKQVLDSLALVPDDGKKVRRRSPSPSKPEIEPLIITHWGQGAPYNDQCPEYDNQKCLTGCVATAMAQIINYHKWPQGNTSTINSYTTSSLGINVPELAATSFNWNNMTDDEIAKLMRYCGQAVRMDYTTNASGSSRPEEAFINVFGYSKSTHGWGGKKFSSEELENLVYNELNDSRPVFYTGRNSGGGHAFVVDGYNNGLFHINWGWNGDEDGYFVLTGLTEDVTPYPFSYDTELTIGIQPKAQSAETSPVIAESCNFIPRSAYRNNSSESFIQQLSFSSNLCSDFDGTTYQIGFGLYNENGSLVKVLGSETSTVPLPHNDTYIHYMTWGADVAVGDYLIIPIYRHNESEEWKKDEGINTYHIIAHVHEKYITFDLPRSDDNGGYTEYGVYDINGITYKLFSEYSNNWADILPYQITGKYSGNIVIPNKVEAEGKTFIVERGEFNPFVECDELLTITSSVEKDIDIYNCPNLTGVTLLQGNSIRIKNCDLLEDVTFPSTMNSPFIDHCSNLKTIRFKCEALDLIRQDLIHWDSGSLPQLTDIYFSTPYPPGFEQDQGTEITSNNNVTIHVPAGCRTRYLVPESAWKNWNIADDEPTVPFVTWGYCPSDAISNSGMLFGSADNDTEIAMKVPSEELNIYKGSKITHIQVYSPGRSINDFGAEDYEYVFITKQGTDYLVKQPFNVMRGAWNTIELDNPYTITGEELFVGIGRHGKVGINFAKDNERFVLTWLRAMGNDANPEAHIGEWMYGCPKDLAHPLPLRFGINGTNMPEGLAIGELKVTNGSSPARRRSIGDTTIQGLVRNRSKETVSSYTVAYSVDGGATQTQDFATALAPNETETIEITLNGISSGEHTISMDVNNVNGGANELSNQNSPSMIVNNGQQVEYVNVAISSIGKLAYSSPYALDFSDVVGLKAYTITGYDHDNQMIWMTRINNAPAGSGVMLKGAEGTYEIPVRATSLSSYKNYMKAIVEGGTVNQTEGDLTNYYLAGSGTNGPGLYQVDGSVILGANRSYLQLPTTLSSSGSVGTENITISSIGKLCYSSNNGLDFTNVAGLKAYTVTGYNQATGTIWLSRVNKVPALTGIYLKGDPGNYTVPTLSLSGCYSNMLKPCIVSSAISGNEGDLINYYLAGSGTNGPGFYPVEGSVTLGNNRSYLQIPTTVGTCTRAAEISVPAVDNFNVESLVESMPLFGIQGNGTTKIEMIKDDTTSEEVFYNLSGQRTHSPSKGFYIRNGKKVIVF